MAYRASKKAESKTIKRKLDPLSLVLIFMLAVYPLLVVPGPLNYFRGPRYIVLVLVALVSLYLLTRERVNFKQPYFYLLGLFVVFATISTLMSPDVSEAWLGSPNWYTGLSTYLFCIILFVLASRVDGSYNFFLPMVASATVVSILALLQHFGLNLVPHELSRADLASYGTMGHPNWLGTYTVLVLPAAIYFFLRDRHLLWLLAGVLISAALIVSMTRGAWLSFFVVFVIIMAYSFKYSQNRKLIVSFILAVAVVALILLPLNDWDILERIMTIGEQIEAAIQLEGWAGARRIHIWQGAIEAVPGNWAFGLGPDHFSEAQVYNRHGTPYTKVHNMYLEVLVTMGVFAFLSYFAFLFYMLLRAGKHSFLFFILIFAYLLRGLFAHDVVEVLPLFWIVLGLSLANEPSALKVTREKPRDGDLKENGGQPGGPGKTRTSPLFRNLISGCLVIFVVMLYYFFLLPGEGTVELPGGGRYTGELRGSSFHGEGTWESGYGVTYTGEFYFGYFQGEGKMTFPNGTQYIGEFRENQMHGYGKMIFPDGRVKEGLWQKGEFVGNQ